VADQQCTGPGRIAAESGHDGVAQLRVGDRLDLRAELGKALTGELADLVDAAAAVAAAVDRDEAAQVLAVDRLDVLDVAAQGGQLSVGYSRRTLAHRHGQA
jgi:hypothetical protein